MLDIFKKYCFIVSFIFLINACGKSDVDMAIPGNIYSHKTKEIKLLLNTREFISTYATYKWAICNKRAFKDHYYKQTIEQRIEVELIDTMRDVASRLQSSSAFFSDITAEKIKKELSNSINEKGLCVAKLKLYPYNKSLQPTAESGD